MPYYAVANGKNIGIFTNWNDCSNSVKGYSNALYKKFDTKEEANNFIQENIKNINGTNIQKQSKISSLFDNDFYPDYYVYTDGACSNNGKENASAGIGIFFGVNDIRNISKKIEGNKQIIQQS